MKTVAEITTEVKNVPALRFPEFEGEWEEVRMQCLQKDGYDITYGILKPEEYVVGGIVMLQIKDILHNKADLSNLHLISDKLHKQYKRTIIDENDIVLSVVGTIGRVAKIPSTLKGMNIHRNLALLKINHHSSSDFIYQILISSKVQREIDKRIIGSTQQLYNLKDLRNLEFCLPSLSEQQKIASFLSAADDKIQQLSKKKVLLEKYKNGVMQQIFSQQIRFKDENGKDFPEWEVKRLGEISRISKGKGVSKSDITENGNLECIRYGELYTHYGEVIQEVISKTNVSINELVLSEYNDVIIPASGETQLDIAKASCVLKDGVALGGDLNIIKVKANGIFLSYYINSKLKKDIAKLAQGVSVVHLYASQLQSLKLYLPCLAEQTKIANFLISIDDKINFTTKQLEQARLFKKGLLQQMFV